MNKDYIYKAKSLKTGEWIEGYILIWKGMAFICSEPGTCMNGHEYQMEYLGFGKFVEVNPNTICRCTGKEYMDSEIAFEGDIMESQTCGLRMLIKYGTYEAYCPEDKECMDSVGFYAQALGYKDMPIGDLSDYALKVGNIFDNPELMEAGVKND